MTFGKWGQKGGIRERRMEDYHEAPPRGVECPFCGRRVRVGVVRGRATVLCGGCGNRFSNPWGRSKEMR